MLALWLLAVSVILIYSYFKIITRRFSVIDKHFPGPKKVPMIGNALEYMGSNEALFKKLQEVWTTMTVTFRIWYAHKPYIVIIDPDDTQVVFGGNLHLDKSDLYELMRPWTGSALVTTNVAGSTRWKTHRKIIQSTFNIKVLESFLEIFNTNADKLVNKLLQEISRRSVVEVSEIIGMYALDNLSETAMGTEMNFQQGTNPDFLVAMKNVSATICQRMAKYWLQSDLIFSLSPAAAMQEDALKLIHSTSDMVIASKRRDLLDSGWISSEKRRKAFLDLILESQETKGWPDRFIREEVDGLMMGGHGTITACLSFAIYELAANPDIQEKAYQEQVNIFGESKTRDPDRKDLQEMKYLEQILKETMRLYPPVPFIGRTLHEDMTLSGGRIIPKGVQVTLLIIALHRNRAFWSDPDTFNPDNFTPERISSRHPYVYVPFSVGPRNCLGKDFAMMEMKSGMSKLLRRFQFTSSRDEAHKLNLVPELILNSTNGFHVEMHERS